MPNIAQALKAEIVRLARKQQRSETESSRKALSSARSEIVALKRRVLALEQALKKVARAAPGRAAEASAQAAEGVDARFRFRASGLASNRKRLGLSAADFALLVGATGQSVYAWEQRKSKPTGAHLRAIAALRGVGKREAARRLAALKQAR